MANNNKIKQNYKDIANAIRAKTGSEEQMTASQMPEKISEIETGITPEGTLDITENAENIDVTTKAAVNVNVPIPAGYLKPSGELTITKNTISRQDISNFEKLSARIISEGDINAPVLAGFLGAYNTVNAPIDRPANADAEALRGKLWTNKYLNSAIKYGNHDKPVLIWWSSGPSGEYSLSNSWKGIRSRAAAAAANTTTGVDELNGGMNLPRSTPFFGIYSFIDYSSFDMEVLADSNITAAYHYVEGTLPTEIKPIYYNAVFAPDPDNSSKWILKNLICKVKKIEFYNYNPDKDLIDLNPELTRCWVQFADSVTALDNISLNFAISLASMTIISLPPTVQTINPELFAYTYKLASWTGATGNNNNDNFTFANNCLYNKNKTKLLNVPVMLSNRTTENFSQILADVQTIGSYAFAKISEGTTYRMTGRNNNSGLYGRDSWVAGDPMSVRTTTSYWNRESNYSSELHFSLDKSGPWLEDTIIIPNTVTTIEDYAFYHSRINKIDLSNCDLGAMNISSEAFNDCCINTIILPEINSNNYYDIENFVYLANSYSTIHCKTEYAGTKEDFDRELKEYWYWEMPYNLEVECTDGDYDPSEFETPETGSGSGSGSGSGY